MTLMIILCREVSMDLGHLENKLFTLSDLTLKSHC